MRQFYELWIGERILWTCIATSLHDAREQLARTRREVPGTLDRDAVHYLPHGTWYTRKIEGNHEKIAV